MHRVFFIAFIILLSVDFGCAKQSQMAKTEDGKQKEAGGLILWLTTALGSLVVTSCGKTSSTSATGAVTDRNTAMSSIPSSDPASMDYTQTSVSASSTQSTSRQAFGGAQTIYVKLTHTAGTGLGNFKLYQCTGNTPAQMGYMTIGVADDVYTGTILYRRSPDTTDIEYTRKAGVGITDDSFSGTLDFKYNSEARLTLTASGTDDSNSLKGTKGDTAISCKWNSTLGCAKFRYQGTEGNSVPFTIAVSNTGAKTYTASSDDSMCTDLTFTSVAANATLSTDQTWDCSLPAGTDWTTVSKTAQEIEDAGGGDCKTKTDFWESMTPNPGACGNGNTAASAGCFCDALYAIGSQSIRMASRMFVCKGKGIFKLIKNGTITDIDLTEGGSIYLKIVLGS